MRERQWVTKRNQIRRALGRHDSGESRGFQWIAFRCAMFAQGRHGCGAHQDTRGSDSTTRSRLFSARINHADAALIVDMREL
jgi:hypothetical protein